MNQPEDNSSVIKLSAWDLSGSRRWSVHLFFLMALLLIIYAPTISALVHMWWSSDDYSHGFLVPFIALYLVWIKREQATLTPVSPNLRVGMPVMAVAGLLLITGDLGGVVLLQELSLIVMIAGLVALLLGTAHLKNLALPIAYLLFMVKIFGDGMDGFHWPFQLLAANIGVWLLQLFGYAAYQEGVYIQLPRITLEVAAACSGVRFLVSIIAIGIPLAYLTQRSWFRRIGLVAFAVVIAILANGLRVALIGAWTYNGNVNVHGPLHILYGTFVSWAGFIALFAGAWLLGKGHDGAQRPPSSRQSVHGGARHLARQLPQGSEGRQSAHNGRVWLVAFPLLLATGGYYFFHGTTPIPLRHNFSIFPPVIGEWRGEDVDPRTEDLRADGADTELVRSYRNRSGHSVVLYIGYFNDQSQGKELVGYRTSWKFHREDGRVTVPTGSSETYRINRAVAPDRDGSRAVLFWYDLNGRIIASRYEAKFWTLWDAIRRGRTNGALVAVSASLGQYDHPESAFDDEQQFIRDAMSPIRGALSGQ